MQNKQQKSREHCYFTVAEYITEPDKFLRETTIIFSAFLFKKSTT